MMNRYKRIASSALILVALSMSAAVFADCISCKEKMALRQSLKDAAAAALVASKHATKCFDLDDVPGEENAPCCAEFAEAGGHCQDKKSVRAPRPAPVDPCNAGSTTDAVSELCMIQNELAAMAEDNAACCAVICHINEQVRRQGHDAKKCCSRLKDKIDDVEDLVESLLDMPSSSSAIDAVSSVVDNIQVLVESQLDQSALCCSTMEAQISALSASIADVFSLLTTVAECACD